MKTHRGGRIFLAPAVAPKVRKPPEGQGNGAGDVVTCPECQCRIRLNIEGRITKHRPGGGQVSPRRGDVECKGIGLQVLPAQRPMPPTRRRQEYRVELFVDAVDERAVWKFLKQLNRDGNAGLVEEPSVQKLNGRY